MLPLWRTPSMKLCDLRAGDRVRTSRLNQEAPNATGVFWAPGKKQWDGFALVVFEKTEKVDGWDCDGQLPPSKQGLFISPRDLFLVSRPKNAKRTRAANV